MTVRHDIGFNADIDCKLQDNAQLWIGDGSSACVGTVGDFAWYWDGTNAICDPAVDDSLLEWGDGTTSWDQQFFFANSGDYLYFDASASLIYTTDVDVQFKDDDMLVFGTGSGASGDMQMRWDGIDFDVLPTADDSVWVFGDGTLNWDVRMLAGVDDYWQFDASDKAWECHGEARLDFSCATVASANTDGGIIKAGTSGSRVVEDTADMKFISLYLDNGATSGDNRGIYNRLYLTGAGGGGESLRTFTTVEDVAAGTAHGLHASLNFGSTGSVTGLGVAGRNTLHIPNDASWAPGTVAALQAELYSDGTNSDTDGATEVSFLRLVNDGHADGIADVDDDVNLFTLTGGATGAGNVFAAQSGAGVSHTLRVKIHGTTYYLMVSDTQ